MGRWKPLLIRGFRVCLDEQTQNAYFESGASQLCYPESRRNVFPSLAVNLATRPINWDDLRCFYYLASHRALGILCGMEAALNPAWVQYGAMGLLFFLFALVAFKILPEDRKSREKQIDLFAEALKDVEDRHNKDTELVLRSHESTINLIVGDNNRQNEMMQTITRNTEETSKILAAQTEVLRQLYRDPNTRSRATDSQRRRLSEAERAAVEAARKVMDT